MKNEEVRFNSKTNLLEEEPYKYRLIDSSDPNLFREIFPYSEVPKIPFNNRYISMNMPDDIFITDTTFRDGQQSISPYSVKQIVDLFDLLHKLGGKNGVIRQTEFFIYSKKDREAIFECLNKGYKFPEITTWIRASKSDFKLVKDIGVKETGLLVSCSDYHIFKKLKMTRKQAFDHYLSVIRDVIDCGLIPRCHLEDITRSDIYGFVIPLVLELNKIANEANIKIKFRLCDTLGLGIPFSGVVLPRSVPGLATCFQHFCDILPEQMEWHGHNDFYLASANAMAAWLYGVSSINCSLMGIGERTGNIPLEGMVIQYASLRGNFNGMCPEVISEIAEYYKNEIGIMIPSRTPFVGDSFNVTKAGIHADGLLKDEEIYNIFDTNKILNRPVRVSINQSSGIAGIVYWYNNTYVNNGEIVDKSSEIISYIKNWVDNEYENGRQTSISDDELKKCVLDYKTKMQNLNNSKVN